MSQAEIVAHGQLPPAPHYDLDVFSVQVFISLGMPEASLRALFAQALAYGPEKVRFVIRGFEPKQLGATLLKLRSMLPRPLDDEVVIDVDPNSFRAAGVEYVPAFFVKDPANKGMWREVRGDMSIMAAVEYVKDMNRPLVGGPLYSIQEPDLIELLQNMAKSDQYLRKRLDQVRQEAQDPTFTAQSRLPLAPRTMTRLHRPAVPFVEDVEVNGQVLARAGQTINPLEYKPFDIDVLVIAADNPSHVRWAKMVLDESKRAGREVDVMYIGTARISALKQFLAHDRVFPLWPVFAKGFGLEHVPARVMQESGKPVFRIEEIGPEDLPK